MTLRAGTVESSFPLPPTWRRFDLGRWLRRGLLTGVLDPAELWETPVARLESRWVSGPPVRAWDRRQVPAEAMAALESACGSLPPDRLFVVQPTVRLVAMDHWVETPFQVLAFGDRAVALWIEGWPSGVMAIPIDRLTAIDNRRIFLYGRLRVIAAEARLAVRYDTVDGQDLLDNLARLRREIASAPVPTEPGFLWLGRGGEQRDPELLPYRWRFLLRPPSVLANTGETGIVAVGDVAETRRGRSGPLSRVAVLTPTELVIASEPATSLSVRYGIDLLAVPRDRLRFLAWDGRALTVWLGGSEPNSDSASVTLPLDGRLVEAMWRSFGPAVAWT